MTPINTSAITVSTDGTCGSAKMTKCPSGCCSQYGNCGTTSEFCSGSCQHAFGTGCTDVDISGSWQSALQHGVTDKAAGGQYYFDAANKLFWTWDTTDLIKVKMEAIVRKYQLGGVMAWSMGEDTFDWSHVKAMAEGWASIQGGEVAKKDMPAPEAAPYGTVDVDAAPKVSSGGEEDVEKPAMVEAQAEVQDELPFSPEYLAVMGVGRDMRERL
jgi:chitinase